MPPISAEVLRDEAYRQYQAGNSARAEEICRELLAQEPPIAEAVYLMGVIAHDVSQLDRAGEFFQWASRLSPDNAVFVNALGEVNLALKKSPEALACFQRALALRPAYERSHNNLGRLLHGQGDLKGAHASFSEAVRLNPRYTTALNNLGAVLQAMSRFQEAAACFRSAIQQKPDYPEANFNLGAALQTLGDSVGALQHFQRAIELRPNYARAHFQMGQVLEAFRHDYAALAAYEQAARLQPEDVEFLQKLGDFLTLKGDWESAIATLERAAALAPDRPEPFARLSYARQLVCDWHQYDADQQRLWHDCEKALQQGQQLAVTPFQALTLPWSLERQLIIANSSCQATVRQNKERGFKRLSPRPEKTPTGRIRIGYLSGDYYDHPISHLIQGLFGSHDRNRFEIFTYGFGKGDDSTYRKRIVSGSEHFVELGALSIPAIADRIAADGVQILVDLMGHTGINRLSTLALRPAPIQVNFLGMLGTIGGDFMDYLITDRTVTPPEYAPYFVETFVTMPHSYLIAEPEASIPENTIDRSKYGLPDNAFVYCSFNSSYKLEPRMFGVWMRILSQVPESVLWLHSPGTLFEKNLRREAEGAGVDPSRIIFASFVPRPEHMRRHHAADLFLDTLLYNAAATASLSLQMSLPVLTCLGNTFGSRIGASLLNTVGLPELITANLEDYERLAVELARNPTRLKEYRDRLSAGRPTSPLYDTARFVRHLEQAYQTMWERHEAGNPPAPIVVNE
jgi:protein O-GlcNAc transferase